MLSLYMDVQSEIELSTDYDISLLKISISHEGERNMKQASHELMEAANKYKIDPKIL